MNVKLCVMGMLLGAAVMLPAMGASAREPALAGLGSPVGMVYDRNGNLFVAEWGANRVSRIEPSGRRDVVIDSVRAPAGLAFDARGTLYIAGYADGNIYAWNGREKPGILASGLSAPTGLFWSGETGLLVANRNAGEVVRISPDGRMETVSGNHKTPVGLARTADGSIYVSCYGGSVDVLAPDGSVKNIQAGLDTPGAGIVAAGHDSVFVVDYAGGDVFHVNGRGSLEAVARGLHFPVGLARMPDGRLLAGCWGDGSAFIIDPNYGERHGF